jgi:catechol 1,2-dioxygenase
MPGAAGEPRLERELLTTPDALTAAVLARFAGTPPRLREIMTALVRHLHAFAREVRLTEPEWLAGIRYLTATGQTCTEVRQEFILLSDTLGLSMLVDLLANARPGATESTVLGPFHVDGAPRRSFGDSIVERDAGGEPTVVAGTVRDLTGAPVGGALLDVWQTDEAGHYDVQDPSVPAGNLRGRFRTGPDGAYRFRTTMPHSYAIPDDGPVGDMLRATGRHPWRPAHIHAIVSAPGFRPVTTHVFDADDPYLAGDAVFAVKDSLVREFSRVTSPEEAEQFGVTAPFRFVAFDIVLAPEHGSGKAPAGD